MSLVVKTQSFLVEKKAPIDLTISPKTPIGISLLILTVGNGIGGIFEIPLPIMGFFLLILCALATYVVHDCTIRHRRHQRKQENAELAQKLEDTLPEFYKNILPKIMETSRREKWTLMLQVSLDKDGPRNGSVLCKTPQHDISTFCTQAFQKSYQNVLKEHPGHLIELTYIAELPLNTMTGHEHLKLMQNPTP